MHLDIHVPDLDAEALRGDVSRRPPSVFLFHATTSPATPAPHPSLRPPVTTTVTDSTGPGTVN